MKIITLENETESNLIKNALQRYVRDVNENDEHMDIGGVIINIMTELPVIEKVIRSIEHASDQPASEVMYSALDLAIGESETIAVIREKIGDPTLLASIDDSAITTYYTENIFVPTEDVTAPTIEPTIEPTV